MTRIRIISLAALIAAVAGPSFAESHTTQTQLLGTGLSLPEMNSEEGRRLFASKGCVVCHSINGVGGVDAPMLDAEFMDTPMNPFEFAARMWRGADAMVELQRDELGDVIDLNGEELAAIIAFVHDADEQALFSEKDIPEEIGAMMDHMEDDEAHAEEGSAHD